MPGARGPGDSRLKRRRLPAGWARGPSGAGRDRPRGSRLAAGRV